MKKKELESLLIISKAVARIQDRKQLLKTIYERIKPVFPYDSYGLFVLTEDQQQHYELIDAEINVSPEQAAVEEQYGMYYRYHHPGSVVDRMMQQGPGLFLIEDFLNDHPQLPIMHEASLRQMIGGPLTYGGEAIGMICFNSKQEDFYTKQHLPLFEAISEQMSVAVANVLANEQLVEEKQFKETLLSISEAVASIQDRKQLLKTIYQRIQPVFPYDTYGLFVLTEDKQHHYELIDAEVMDNDPTQTVIEQQYGAHHRYAHPESPVEYMMQRGPGLFTVNEFLPHTQAPPMYEAGLRQIIAGPLVYGDEAIGMLCFNSKQENFYTEAHLPLFTAIAEQLSIATANVLANERLIREKKKTEDLLAITESIANITTGPELVRAIFDKLQKVFPFDEAGLFHLDFEQKRERDLIVDYSYDTAVPSQEIQDFGLIGWLPLSKLSQHIAKETVVFTTEALYQQYDHPHFKHSKKVPFQQMIAGPLQRGQETIGLLYFWSKIANAFDHQQSLFKSITDQMSVALSNILAHEDIQRREREEAFKLSLVDALNQRLDWSEKLLSVARLLQGTFPFHLLTLTTADQTLGVPSLGFHQIGPDEYRTLELPALLKMLQLTPDRFHQARQRYNTNKPTIYNNDDYIRLTRQNLVEQALYDRFGIRSQMTIPLRLGSQKTIDLTFYAREQRAYHPDHLALFQRIAPSLTLALEKQLHYQEVLRLNDLIAQENQYLQQEIQVRYNFGEMVGNSTAIREVFEKIQQVARTNSNVLITGETGTGKELVARALHQASHRKAHSFVKLNCATLPAELLESELFGHEKGAFTGADKRRIGKFELAHRGTIFLDEIGELPLALQAKLLRVLQEREFERLGGNEIIRPDVRVVAATNRKLTQEVAQHNFRSDLFYRLNVFPIHLPPLRERKEDIPDLAQHFIQKHNKRLGKKVRKLSQPSLQALLSYPWPGNIRELEHVIERAMIIAEGTTLKVALEKTPIPVASSESGVPALKTYRQGEIDLIMNTLRYTQGKVSGVGGAAEILDMNRATLESKMRKFGITKKHVVRSSEHE